MLHIVSSIRGRGKGSKNSSTSASVPTAAFDGDPERARRAAERISMLDEGLRFILDSPAPVEFDVALDQHFCGREAALGEPRRVLQPLVLHP